MKLAAFAACGLLCLSSPVASEAAREKDTPITRIVKLLQGLSLKTKLEGKAEENLFDDYVCWAKSVISQKTASNGEASARIGTLQAYVEDIDAGRVEFTTERADLEKELKELTDAIEAATALREKEHDEFLTAEDEMTKAVTALGKALEVLHDATEGHTEGTFFAQGFLSRSQEVAALNRAVELGNRVLKAGDALFLRRILTGEVPEVDWSKLNREATFKQGYKGRSFEIQGVLQKLQGTFSDNLKDARAKEADAQALFEKLLATQTAQKAATEEAYRKLDAETGARGNAKAESEAEISALTEQVKNDELFIEQTRASLAEKKEEWSDRSSLRAAEIAAFSKAIEILGNDDARDLLKRSYTSQGYSLLQQSRVRDAQRRLASSAEVLRTVGIQTSDARLTLLALRASTTTASHFKAVIKAIDTLVSDLESEEREDLARKEQCEEDRAKDAREAILASRTVDETTDSIASLQAEVAELERAIAEKKAAAALAKDDLAAAAKLRSEENVEFQRSQEDDKEAVATVGRAIDVLKNFYAENKLVLAQQPVEVPLGQAPPPPPSTWEAPYGGKTKQAGSVIDTLAIAQADIEKDSAKAKADEDKAQQAFDKLKADTEALINALEGSIIELRGAKGEKETTVAENTVSRGDKKGELGAIVARIKNAEPGCDFLTINYPVRVKNRQIEVDGLQTAKTILSGGTFAHVDPNRELTVGDA